MDDREAKPEFGRGARPAPRRGRITSSKYALMALRRRLIGGAAGIPAAIAAKTAVGLSANFSAAVGAFAALLTTASFTASLSL